MADKISIILADPAKRASLQRRLWAQIRGGDNSVCWEWFGKARANGGYGRLSAGRKIQVRAHIAVWVLTNGPIPEGLCVLHKCDNPSCCNPDHLFLGTKADNTHDMMSKGRMSAPPIHLGEAHPRATLTVELVKKIRAIPKWKHGDRKRLAAEWGISPKNISDVRYNKVWGHIQ